MMRLRFFFRTALSFFSLQTILLVFSTPALFVLLLLLFFLVCVEISPVTGFTVTRGLWGLIDVWPEVVSNCRLRGCEHSYDTFITFALAVDFSIDFGKKRFCGEEAKWRVRSRGERELSRNKHSEKGKVDREENWWFFLLLLNACESFSCLDEQRGGSLTHKKGVKRQHRKVRLRQELYLLKHKHERRPGGRWVQFVRQIYRPAKYCKVTHIPQHTQSLFDRL